MNRHFYETPSIILETDIIREQESKRNRKDTSFIRDITRENCLGLWKLHSWEDDEAAALKTWRWNG